MNTPCKTILSLQLQEQQGAILDAEHAALISEHLAECEACRMESLLLRTLGEDDVKDHLPPMNELARRRDQDAVLRRLGEKRRNRIPTSSWKKGALWGGGMLTAAACAWLFLTLFRGIIETASGRPEERTLAQEPLSLPKRLEPPSAPATESSRQDVIETGADSTVLTLAEGARVVLDPHTTILLRREEDGIAVDLRGGTLLADITPGSRRPRFRVSTPVGQVVVKGTIFSVHVSEHAVQVSVSRGEVAVERLGHGPVAVSAGDTMRIDTSSQRPMTPEESRFMARRVRLLSGDLVTQNDSSSDEPTRRESHPSPDGTATDSGSPSPEALLASAARLRRQARWSEAATLYQELIQAYPNRTESKLALVSLGELSLERMNDPASAARWYARYQKESPNGPLFQEAMFGEIQSLERLGDRVLEQRLLKTFLDRFPKAVQAKAAKRRLEQLLTKQREDTFP